MIVVQNRSQMRLNWAYLFGFLEGPVTCDRWSSSSFTEGAATRTGILDNNRMFWGFLWIICVYLFSLYQSFCLPNEHRMEWNPTITRSHVLGVSLVFDFAPFCCFLFSKCQKCSAVEFKLSFSVCHEAISIAFWCLSGILICDLFLFVIL